MPLKYAFKIMPDACLRLKAISGLVKHQEKQTRQTAVHPEEKHPNDTSLCNVDIMCTAGSEVP